jgi:hypothetical protein
VTDKISSHESAILNDFSERPQTSSLEQVDSGCLEELMQRDTRLIYWRTLSDSPSVVSAAALDTVNDRLWIQPVDATDWLTLRMSRPSTAKGVNFESPCSSGVYNFSDIGPIGQ